MIRTYHKDPEDVLDYVINWERWLGDDTISSSSWTVEDGLTKDSEDNDLLTATIWLSGGTLGATYTLTNSIVTAAGRQADQSIRVKMITR